MHGDFSLNPLAWRARVSRVLYQQGRVQLDSDANEQADALLRASRSLGLDVIGAHGGLGDAFEITVGAKKPELQLGWGAYYVDGIRALNWPPGVDVWEWFDGKTKVDDGLAYADQTDYWAPNEGDWTVDMKAPVLFYLDVFERHLSAAEDDSLREVALLGPDTASRALVVWQVRAIPAQPFLDRIKDVDDDLPPTYDVPYVALNLLLRTCARMRARAVISENVDACTVSPDARFRGPENRLFRVEIHDPGLDPKAQPTFKYVQDNGSQVYPVRKIEGKTVHLDSLGRDERSAIQVNDWVEVVDDRVLLMGKAYPLLQVVDVRPMDMTVTLSDEPKDNAGDPDRHAILRRWAGPPTVIKEGKTDRDVWFELADGVEVQFSRVVTPDAGYRTGDYWMIPARTATGDVIWPRAGGSPLAVAPHGIDHHYAPLAVVDPTTNPPKIVKTYRRVFKPAAEPV